MATKKITVFKEGNNYGSYFQDGDEETTWEKLTKEEKLNLIGAMETFAEFFAKFVE